MMHNNNNYNNNRLPPLSTPKTSYLTDVIADAAFIAIVIFYADMTVENVFAKKHGYTIYPNQVCIHIYVAKNHACICTIHIIFDPLIIIMHT